MGHEEPQSVMFNRQGLTGDLHADLLAEELSQPKVVVTGHVDGVYSSLNEGGQLMENAVVMSWYRLFVLKPEIEKIAHNIEKSGVLGDVAKEGDEAFLFAFLHFWDVFPQVGIGDEIDFSLSWQRFPPRLGLLWRA